MSFYTTSFNRTFHRIGTTNSRLWKIWFTFGILIALTTAVIACSTLVILPIKSIYELQRRKSAADLSILTNRGLIDGRLWTDRDKTIDPPTSTTNQRDEHLIQPIVRFEI